MGLNDNAVLVAAGGYVYVALPGTLPPTPDELDASTFDPETYGAQVLSLKVSGTTPVILTVGEDDSTPALALTSTAPQVQAALELLPSVGAGNVLVTGVSLGDTAGLTVTVVGALQGTALDLTGPSGVTVAVVTAANGWDNIGHTSRDDMPEFGFDGGDTSVLGSWQKKRLREQATGDPVADSVTFNLEQWDTDAFELYFGEDSADTDGIFGVSGDFVPVEKALLVILVDGTNRIGFYASKASIKRDDSIDLPVDGLSSLPIRATFLNLGANRLYDWISKKLFKKKSA